MKNWVLAGVAWVAISGAAAAEQLSLNEISRYLNSLKNAKGAFTQINEDGTIDTGTFYLKRPGKGRFEYDTSAALVMIGNGSVGVFDTKLETVEQYPLNRTPLSIILARNVDLGRANMVTGHSYDGTATIVTAQDPEHPEYGSLQMKFTANPVELRQWVVNDDTGSSTTVVLGALDTNARLSNGLFAVSQEAEKYRE